MGLISVILPLSVSPGLFPPPQQQECTDHNVGRHPSVHQIEDQPPLPEPGHAHAAAGHHLSQTAACM